MTSFSPTPGPWRVAGRPGTRDDHPQWTVESEFGQVATVMAENCDDDSQVLADARLMAAAPELQQALAGLLILLEPAWDELSGLVAGGPEAVNAAADAASAALRKARGEA